MLVHRLIAISLVTSALAACSASGSGSSTNPLQPSNAGGTAGASGAGAGLTGAGLTGAGLVGAGLTPAVDNSGGAPDLGPIKEMDPNDPNCGGTVSQGEQITVDIFIMFDQSQSMTCMIPAGGDRWDAVKGALQGFVALPAAAGINVGIQYFGQGGLLGGLVSSCTPADYQNADVEIAPLPMNAQPIIDSLNRHMPSTNTPTPAALTGAINHAIAWKNMHPGHTVVVVLVTDGEPNACGTVDDCANVAAMGLTSTIPTYVIGITSTGTTCNLDPNPPNQADLDKVAMAGGTQAALLVDVTMDTAMQFVNTMNQIRAKTQIPCQYALPKPTSGQVLDPTKVNVQYTPPGSTMAATIPGVTMATCDPTNGGWYYDNPGAPTKINLCPSTCMQVSSMTGGQVQVVVGCKTKGPA